MSKRTANNDLMSHWKIRLFGWRNRILASKSFQRRAASNPLLRPIARRRASHLFDLVAGFAYTQTLLATVESGLLSNLADGPVELGDIAEAAGLSIQAADRLVRAAEALGIAEEAAPGIWMLGRHGAALHGNAGALAMIRHHRLLYADLADPMSLLRNDRRAPTELSKFWSYVGSTGIGLVSEASTARYSRLMRDSQTAVAGQVVAAYPLEKFGSLLDIGGGTGAFLQAVRSAHPGLRTGLFDLPEVVAQARENFNASAAADQPTFHAGSFFSDTIPRGYDVVSLVRILHDHDDVPAQQLLGDIRRAMNPGARLIVAEPMAATRGAEAMGDAYFGFYLWAMGSGRPRRATEIRSMLHKAGFVRSRVVRTDQPLITSLIVAIA